MRQFEKLKEKLRGMEREQRQRWLAIRGAALLLLLLVCAYAVGAPAAMAPESTHGALYYGFIKHFGMTLLLFVLFIGLIILVLYRNPSLRNTVERVDGSRDLSMAKRGDYGDAKLMTDTEIKDVFQVGSIKTISAPVYGQITKDGYGKDVVSYKKVQHGASGNQNVLIIASMGSGKSYGPVRVNLLQALRRGESFVVTDPSGELYSSLSYFAKMLGAKVHVLNLSEPEYSDFWDVAEETIDPDTERLDSMRLDDFANIYMKNSGTDDKEDFWYGCAVNLIQAAIGYIAYKHEKEITDGYAQLYSSITGNLSDSVVHEIKETNCSFPRCRELILEAAEEHGLDLDKVKFAIHEIEEVKPKTKYTIEEVYDLLLHFDNEENIAGMEKIPSWHPAHDAYLMYKTNDKDTVKQSALQGAQLRFKLFKNKKISKVLSNKGIHIDDITHELSAYFVIISDKTTTTKPIASLFFSFLFKDAQDAWDKARTIADASHEPIQRLPLTCMLDEFYSIGIIGGSANSFGVTMSNSRKREIHIWVVVQSYSQLPALYGPEIANVIQGGCSTLLYLGGNDPDTVNFISTFAAGDATVFGESHSETNGFQPLFGGTENVSTHKRALITPDEARRWESGTVLIVRQGQYPAKVYAFPWDQHPAYRICKSVSIYDEIPPVQQRLDEMSAIEAEHPDKNGYIKSVIQDAVGKSVDQNQFDEDGVLIEDHDSSAETISAEKENIAPAPAKTSKPRRESSSHYQQGSFFSNDYGIDSDSQSSQTNDFFNDEDD